MRVSVCVCAIALKLMAKKEIERLAAIVVVVFVGSATGCKTFAIVSCRSSSSELPFATS